MRVPLSLLLVASAAAFLASCGEAEKSYPVQTYKMGDKVTLGHIVYSVYETQWFTHLGEGSESRVPQNRYFLVRMSAVNSGSNEAIIPNLTLEDDQGNSFPELSDGANVPQYIGFLRRAKPSGSVQGNALFDVPPRHYKLRVQDEDTEQAALIDIPLSFTSESPDVPQASDPKFQVQPGGLQPPAPKK